jgi:hypothetical protein
MVVKLAIEATTERMSHTKTTLGEELSNGHLQYKTDSSLIDAIALIATYIQELYRNRFEYGVAQRLVAIVHASRKHWIWHIEL